MSKAERVGITFSASELQGSIVLSASELQARMARQELERNRAAEIAAENVKDEELCGKIVCLMKEINLLREELSALAESRIDRKYEASK